MASFVQPMHLILSCSTFQKSRVVCGLAQTEQHNGTLLYEVFWFR